jgi:putative copper resistance protein D
LIGVHAALALSRFIYDAAIMFVFGGISFVCFIAPRRLGGFIERQLHAPVMVVAVAAVAAALVWLPLEVASIGDAWTEVFNFSLMGTVLDNTTMGHVWVARALIPILLIMAAAADRPPMPVLLALSAVALASLALTGHAMMDEGPRAAVHIINHIVHLLAAAGWIGSLVPVLLCLAALGDPARAKYASLALHRFSVMGHIAVALVVGTGIIDMFMVLGHLPVHWSSPYQALLSIKIALVAGMIGLALVNSYVLMPRVDDDNEATRALRRQTIAELVLATGVLALVAVLGMLDPMD